MTPCNLVGGNHSFVETQSFHLQGRKSSMNTVYNLHNPLYILLLRWTCDICQSHFKIIFHTINISTIQNQFYNHNKLSVVFPLALFRCKFKRVQKHSI